MAVTVVPAQPQHRAALESLLTSFQLATQDLPGHLEGFTLALDDGQLVGSAGLERVGPYGLLRSVAVHEDYRHKGLAERLAAAALAVAQSVDIQEVWLITTTADRYFEKYGFERIERANVPPEIKAIPQFTTLCASTAVVMRKTL